jgi:hypothetical protein
MQLDLKLVLRAGFVWGIIGVLLVLGAAFLGSYLPASINLDPIALGTYAALFAGVHFAYRSADSGIVVAIVGGAVSGVIVALLMIAVGLVVPEVGFSPSDTGALIGALVAGLFGAVGFQIARAL